MNGSQSKDFKLVHLYGQQLTIYHGRLHPRGLPWVPLGCIGAHPSPPSRFADAILPDFSGSIPNLTSHSRWHDRIPGSPSWSCKVPDSKREMDLEYLGSQLHVFPCMKHSPCMNFSWSPTHTLSPMVGICQVWFSDPANITQVWAPDLAPLTVSHCSMVRIWLLPHLIGQPGDSVASFPHEDIL